MTLGQEQGTIRQDRPAAELAEIAQTLIAGFTVVMWIHGIAPTESMVDSLVDALDNLIKPISPLEPTGAVRKPVPPSARKLPRPARHRPRR
jgi:hypothetical protein